VYARFVAKAAKRKKKEESSDFAIPPFDEVAYMKKEMEGAKVAVLAVLLAIPTAAVLYGLTLAGVSIVAFFLGLALTIYLPRVFGVLNALPWPKVDLTKFEKRDWFGHGATFLFSWLAFWILLLNQPFVDVTAPVIGVTVFGGLQTVGMREGDLPNPVPRSGTVVLFNVTILENFGVENATITIAGNTFDLASLGGARYEYEYITSATPLDCEVYARDVSGHASTFRFTVQFT
jgi:hypothetical protein